MRGNDKKKGHTINTEPSKTTQELARRLIAFEASCAELSGICFEDAVRVCEKLRGSLSKLAGVAGFSSLLSRALVLARPKVSFLEGVQVRPDGTLEGYDQVPGAQDPEAGVILVAQLLDLLITFIGEPLTRRVVGDTWPDAPGDIMNSGKKE
jgi:hypothetical protein